MELLFNYEKSLKEIYDHVGFVEDFVVYPIGNSTDKYWYIDSDIVHYANTLDELKNEEGMYYTAEIVEQRFYNKWVYEGKDLTMIFLNPRVDGMRYFELFDNNKKVKYKSSVLIR